MTPEVTQIAAEATKPDVLATLGINWKLFLAQLFNVSIVLVVIWKWVYTPLLKVVDARTKKIEDGLKNAKEADTRLKEAKDHETELLAYARGEAKIIVEAGREKGETERADRVERSKKEIDDQLEEAKRRIQTEQEAAMGAVKSEVASLVMQATKKVTLGAMDVAAQRKQIDEAISELEAANV
jgi:F-type H+-transporting ATPase subunit b